LLKPGQRHEKRSNAHPLAMAPGQQAHPIRQDFRIDDRERCARTALPSNAGTCTAKHARRVGHEPYKLKDRLKTREPNITAARRLWLSRL